MGSEDQSGGLRLQGPRPWCPPPLPGSGLDSHLQASGRRRLPRSKDPAGGCVAQASHGKAEEANRTGAPRSGCASLRSGTGEPVSQSRQPNFPPLPQRHSQSRYNNHRHGVPRVYSRKLLLAAPAPLRSVLLWSTTLSESCDNTGLGRGSIAARKQTRTNREIAQAKGTRSAADRGTCRKEQPEREGSAHTCPTDSPQHSGAFWGGGSSGGGAGQPAGC